MLFELLRFLCVLLIATTLFQIGYVWRYLRFMQSGMKRNPSTVAENHPRAEPGLIGLVLCLRGCDPGLIDCLAAIENQSIRNFDLHLVFDSENDPAVAIARRFADQSELRIDFHFVDHSAFDGGTLKCHALVTAVGHLRPETKILALIDADATVRGDWLEKLTAPFADPAVGAVTGNRWFEPVDQNAGSMLRVVWNAAAVVQMYIYNIAWGGSLAIRVDCLRETGLVDRWRTAFCEDTMVSDHLRRNGWETVRVPDLVVVNRESCSVTSAIHWITRQLLTVRLHHPRWIMVLAHAVSILVCIVGFPILLISGYLSGLTISCGILLIVFLIHQLFNLLLIVWITSANRRAAGMMETSSAVPNGDSPATTLRLAQPGSLILPVLVSQFVQPWTALRALFARRTSWRGIEYQIGGGKIEMESYQPFDPANQITKKPGGQNPDRDISID